MSRPSRRIGAVFLPDLACEIAGQKVSPSLAAGHAHSQCSPLAVVDAGVEASPGEPAGPAPAAEIGEVILAVNETARRYGVRVGQKVAGARALVAHLVVRGLSQQALRAALGRVADVLLEFGTTASIQSGDDAAPLDTVWIDLTGTAHLWGGEEAVAAEMSERVRALGHRAKIAIADGPHLARAAAVFHTESESIVAPSGGRDMMRALPLEALPLASERIVWLHRLGLWTVGDVINLPFASLASRLGESWKETIELARGEDTAPLVAYQPPRAPREETEWDEPVSSVEPLLFALRGLVARLSARLEGRGEAAQAIEIHAPYDRSIAAARGVHAAEIGLRIDLPTALSHAPDLFRVLKTKLEHTELAAPVTGLSIAAPLLTHAVRMQLSLDGDRAVRADPRLLAVLLAEVSAEIGAENVGVLELVPVHRPEARTRLVPLGAIAEGLSPSSLAAAETTKWSCDEEFPTRLLAEPVPLPIFAGPQPMVTIDKQLFDVSAKSHSIRFEAVEWWTAAPMCRDYARVLLTSGSKSIQAWVFTDRTTGRAFLHGYFD